MRCNEGMTPVFPSDAAAELNSPWPAGSSGPLPDVYQPLAEQALKRCLTLTGLTARRGVAGIEAMEDVVATVSGLHWQGGAGGTFHTGLQTLAQSCRLQREAMLATAGLTRQAWEALHPGTGTP